MSFPASLSVITVHGTFLDGAGAPRTGRIIFRTAGYIMSGLDDTFVVPRILAQTLDSSGHFSIAIAATNDPDWTPTGWTYRVSLDFGDDGWLGPWDIVVPYDSSGGAVSLAALAPVPASDGQLYALYNDPRFSGIGGGGGGAVASVFGRSGAVVAQTGDYTKTQVGLANVDNTSDVNKPVSTPQAVADALVASNASSALTAGLSGKAATVHVHAEADVTSLVSDLGGKQPLDTDLTTIAGLTATTDNVLQSVASAWASRTPAQLKTTLALVKGDVGLSNVDNTTDVGKPVSSAAQTALNLKADLAGPTFTGTVSGITATMVGLGNVTNTSDANKPVSTAQQTALNLKADLAGPTFTGVPAAPTASAATSTTQLATTAFVTTADNLKANLASPTFTGTPAAPTAAPGVNTTQLATTAFVAAAAALQQPLDTDLTTIAGLTATTGNMILAVASAWASQTPTQVKTALALNNVDNTSDVNKPVSTAQATADALAVQKSVATTKGDLLVATAANTVTRLGVGADTFVLTADSTAGTGTKWAAAAGGSGTDFKVAAVPLTGKWYRAPTFGPVGANLAMTLNRCYYSPFRLDVTTTFDRIGIDVATAAAATGVCRLGIFAADAAGAMPGTLVLDAGTVLVDSTGQKNITISQALTAGVYWLAADNQVAAGCNLRSVVSYDPLVPYATGASMFIGTTAPGGMFANTISGAFASTPTIVDNDNGPIIGLRAV